MCNWVRSFVIDQTLNCTYIATKIVIFILLTLLALIIIIIIIIIVQIYIRNADDTSSL